MADNQNYPDLSQPLQEADNSAYPDFSQAAPQEGFGEAAVLAVPRIAEDVARGAYSMFQKIPEYYKKAKTEVPGVFGVIQEHPLHGLGQLGAGIVEQGHNILNMPRSLSEYAENRLNLLPRGFSEQIPYQQDISQGMNAIFGKPKYPGEELIRGLGRNQLAFTGGAGTLAKVNPLRALNRVNPRQLAKNYQISHDALNQSAIDKFNRVGKEVIKRNADVVPIRTDLISDIVDQKILPKTNEANKMLNKAFSGDYEGLRELQTEMFHQGNKFSASKLPSVSNRGKKILELREEINDSIENHLRNQGHHDLADLLNNGRKQYAVLKDIYYHKELPVALRKLVEKESRKIPKDMVGALSQESKPLAKVKEYNPFIGRELAKHQRQQNALRNLKWLTIGSGVGGLAGLTGLGIKSIADFISKRE